MWGSKGSTTKNDFPLRFDVEALSSCRRFDILEVNSKCSDPAVRQRRKFDPSGMSISADEQSRLASLCQFRGAKRAIGRCSIHVAVHCDVKSGIASRRCVGRINL